MDHLHRCDAYSNDVSVRDAIPACEVWRKAVYVPIDDHVQWEHDCRWGLYDADRNLIDAAAYYRGPGKNLVGQQAEIPQISMTSLEQAPPGRYLYGGNIISHYGHFLISVLSRFWLGLFEDLREYKIVCHGAGVPEGWLSHPFIRQLFEANGLTQDHFVVFKRPTILPEILVPRPAAEEHNFAHKIFAAWGHAAGTALIRNTSIASNPKPAWLAKTRLPGGVQGFENEASIVSCLEDKGIDIIHPQEMSLIEQVILFRTRPLILGTAGSAFHTKIFGTNAELFCLIPGSEINSNYAVIDGACGTNINFLRAEMQGSASEAKRFMAGSEFVDPEAVAEDIAALVRQHV